MKITVSIDDAVWRQTLDFAKPGMNQADIVLEAITTFIRVSAAESLAEPGRVEPDVDVPRRKYVDTNDPTSANAESFWSSVGTESDAMWAVAIIEGLPVSFLNEMASAMCLKPKELATLAGIKSATLRRWRKSGRLDVTASDRFYEIAVVIKACVKLFGGDNSAALLWLKRPTLVLGNRAPIEFLHIFTGIRLLKSLIWRIENGVVS